MKRLSEKIAKDKNRMRRFNNKRGRVVIENSKHKGKAGDGQFLKRGTCVNI